MSEAAAVDASPFDLAPAERAGAGDPPPAVLCIHGLTGTPYEVRPVAEALVARGFRARGPLLPGHGRPAEELARCAYADWLECVRSEYAQLAAAHGQVFVVGMSLGGLLALVLASETTPSAAAVVGVPLRFTAGRVLAIAVGRFVKPMLPKRDGSDIADPAARARHPGTKMMPLASAHELVKLQKRVRALLPRVRAPLFVGHGALDRTASPEDAVAIAAGVGSAEVVERRYAHSAHVVPVDVDGPALARDVAGFFGRFRESAR
ncbi:MAG: alpha/beta fold hydrolase [Myxococcota bacterium]